MRTAQITQQSEDWTLSAQQPTSQNISKTDGAGTRLVQNGVGAGKLGAAKLSISEIKKMAATDPVEMDRTVEALLPVPVASLLSSKTDYIVTQTYGTDSIFAGFEFKSSPPTDSLKQALLVVDRALTPCPEPIALAALASLALRTKARKNEGGDMDARNRIYAKDLAGYPPDVVVFACKAIGDTATFYPAWSELKNACDERVNRRRSLRAAIAGEIDRQEKPMLRTFKTAFEKLQDGMAQGERDKFDAEWGDKWAVWMQIPLAQRPDWDEFKNQKLDRRALK